MVSRGGINREDGPRIANYLGITEEDFNLKYTTDRALNFTDEGCVFLLNGKCSIHSVKPRSCVMFKCQMYEPPL